MSNIYQIFGRVWREKGAKTERKVQQALDLLKEKGEIDKFFRSKSLERRGVDFEVDKGSKRYKLSVKSSEGGVSREREGHPERFRHNDIIFIVPMWDESREALAERILAETAKLELQMHEPELRVN